MTPVDRMRHDGEGKARYRSPSLRQQEHPACHQVLGRYGQ